VKQKGDKEQALELAWEAIAIWHQEEKAIELIRVIEDLHSTQAWEYELEMEGSVTDDCGDGEHTHRFIVSFSVVADHPEEAFALASRFVPEDVQSSLQTKTCKKNRQQPDRLKGVYTISDYDFFAA
jgi:hypothetical protein